MSAADISAGRREAAARYDLRHLHDALCFGTASDRFAGWIGSVYPADHWENQISTRTKKVGGGTVEERMLPVDSVAAYFEHFGVLELDFTFYRPLLEEDGRPSSALFTLQRYAEHAPDRARFLVKAPQTFSARTLRRSSEGKVQYVENPDYLDADAFCSRFLLPARDTLGDRLSGVLFEQAYARVQDSPAPHAFVGELDAFFASVPDETSLHLEVRSPHLLTPPYFDWLQSRGLGFIYSHWTWLPSLQEQWRLAGERLLASGDEVVLRLLCPREMRFNESLRLAHPFSKPVPALAATPQARQMVDEATALMYKAIESDVRLNVIASNRAWGSAPDLARALADRFLDFAARFGA